MGDANAQIEIGSYYSKQLPGGHSKMMQWWREAASQGSSRAQRLYAQACVENYNKQTGDAEWLKWIQQAADANDEVAQRMLGNSYAKGEHTPTDLTKALKLWRKAALQGDFEAIKNLEDSYSEGRGISKDEREALVWFHVEQALLSSNITEREIHDSSTDRTSDQLKIEVEQKIDAMKKSSGTNDDAVALKKANGIADRIRTRTLLQDKMGSAKTTGKNLAQIIEETSASKSFDRPPIIRIPFSPFYPPALLHSGINGYAEVEFIVTVAGKVGWARVTKSNNPAFEQPALDAVLQWQFEAAQRSGHPVNIKVKQRIDFTTAKREEIKS